MSLSVRLLTDNEFAASRESWQALLASSDADPLFMGWDWQWTWWQHHQGSLRASLLLLAVTDDDGRTTGLAPLYLRDTRMKGVLPVRRLECMGTAWREKNTAFSEYFDVIAERGRCNEVVSAVASWLATHPDWDDWAISHVRPDALVQKVAAAVGASVARARDVEAMPTHFIDLAAGFTPWLGRLSSDVRRRLHHQRNRLQQPQFRLIAPSDVAHYLERLQQWRAGRYQGGGAGRAVCAFEQALAARLAASGSLRLSELTHRGQALSLMLDVRMGDTEYYLAGAFSPDAERGISPGYLHFGYAIEAASAAGAKRFDLLAGHGRSRDYKSDLGSEAQTLCSRQVIRAPMLKFLHRLTGSG